MITIPIIFTFLGIGVLLFGAYTANKLRKGLQGGQMQKAWDAKIMSMIGMFIVGYTLFLVQLVTDITFMEMDLIASSVFFAGSIFVASVSYFNYKALT